MLAPVNREFRCRNPMQPAMDETFADDIAHDFPSFQDSQFRFLIVLAVNMPAYVLIGLADEAFVVLQAIVVEERLADTGKAAGPVFPEELDVRIVDHSLAEFTQEAEIRLPGRFQFMDAKRGGQHRQQALAVPRRFPDVVAAAQKDILPAIIAQEHG